MKTGLWNGRTGLADSAQGDVSISPTRRSAIAFTLVELLVVIGIIAILAALLLPALVKAKQKAWTVYCLNNGRQVTLSILLYASDSGDWLPPNDDLKDSPTPGYSPNYISGEWVSGIMITSDATNVACMIDPQYSRVAPYIGSQPGIFKCPADKSTWTDPGGKAWPRVRSYSMNSAVGTQVAKKQAVDGSWLDGNGRNQANNPWRTYGRMAEMTDPGPAGLYMILGQHENSIHDMDFDFMMVTDPTTWLDWPEMRHNFAGMFAFADGHSESHKWTDGRTMKASQYSGESGLGYLPTREGSPDNKDIIWIQQRTSAVAK
jgi:prepilin-type N-terminal cleavage/methylation domain-containing protein/prepilin-type processing-associated H-X9-DG protein